MVSGLRELGTTIMLTTHYMDEAQELADNIVVIGGGKVVAQGTPDALGGRDTAAAPHPLPAARTPSIRHRCRSTSTSTPTASAR